MLAAGGSETLFVLIILRLVVAFRSFAGFRRAAAPLVAATVNLGLLRGTLCGDQVQEGSDQVRMEGGRKDSGWQGLASALQLEMLESLDLRNLNLTRLHRFKNHPWKISFPVLPALTNLDISGNRLTGGLEALEGCPNLRILCIEDNLIEEVELLKPLRKLKHLTHLNIKGNPFQDKDYWHRAREILPSITYLDDRDVDYKEETDDFENLLGILPKLGF